MTDSPTGNSCAVSELSKGAVGTSGTLSSRLDEKVLHYRANSFAASTSKTYSAQRAAYLKFCSDIRISPIPISQTDLGRYIAYLSRRLCFSSIRQYLNIVRLMHLEAGLPNPLEKNWYVASILKGVRRVKGDASVQKLPITINVLKQVFPLLNLHSSFDRCFWAACLVGFFSFFRKSNLLVASHLLFNPERNLCASDVRFTVGGAVLSVRWSKVIQFKERILHIPLPKIPDSPFCPSTALLLLTLENPATSLPTPLFRYSWLGANNVPMTQHLFSDRLKQCLGAIGLDASRYSGHSFRRGGAQFALQCGLPVDLIKLQGDWRSNACDRYLEPSFELRQQVARTMGLSVDKNSSS